MHRDAHNVLGERDLAGLVIVGADQAGHGMVGVEDGVLDQRLHGLEAAPASHHGIAFSAVLGGGVGADHEVLQQSEGGDRGLELRIGPGIGRRLADVLGGEGKPGSAGSPG